MRTATYLSFMDELEKIAAMEKKATTVSEIMMAGALLGSGYGALRPGHNEKGEKKSRLGGALKGAGKGLALTTGAMFLPGLLKNAGLIQNLGSRLRSAPSAALGLVKATPGAVQGGIRNAGSAVSAFANPVQSFKKGWQTSVTDFGKMGPGMKALAVTGLVAGGHEALSKEDPMRQGRSRTVRVGTAIGDQVGGIIGSPFGLAGGIVGGQIGRKAGGLVGKGVEVARNLKKKHTAPANPPPERTT